MATAGRTVAFSAFTVAIALGAMLLFPIGFLRSFAYAGVAVVVLAGIATCVVLPAILAALGPRIEKWSLFKHKEKTSEHGFFYRQSHAVMKYPIPVIIVVTLFLVALGIPFLRIELGQADDRALPKDAPSRIVHDQLRENFDSNEAGATPVVLENAPDGDPLSPKIDAYAKQLSAIDGVARVDAPTGFYVDGANVLPPGDLSQRYVDGSSAWLSVVPSVEPFSPEGEAMVREIRALDAPADVLVGGFAGRLIDTKDAISRALPIAIAFMAVMTFLLLFLMVGSVLVPIKALLLNFVSLTATFGSLVWIFQDGHLSGFLNFTATGSIASFTPISMFCIAFGLSMDYEVFLLSRIKEHYDLHGDNDQAVAHGLELSGRVVTAAAILLCVVFVAFATSDVSLVKSFGVGMTIAILVDAFIIRITLVPALMKLAGRANWWAPHRLRRAHLRFGIWEPEALEIYDTPLATEAASPAPVKRKPAAKRKAAPKRKPATKRAPATKPKTTTRRG